MNEGKVYRSWDLQDHSIIGDVKWFLTWICTCGLENKVKERLKMTAIHFQITSDSLTFFFSSFEVQLIPSFKGNRSLYTLERVIRMIYTRLLESNHTTCINKVIGEYLPKTIWGNPQLDQNTF